MSAGRAQFLISKPFRHSVYYKAAFTGINDRSNRVRRASLFPAFLERGGSLRSSSLELARGNPTSMRLEGRTTVAYDA